MRIEVWSDVVCPWCYIGKRRLERALADFEHADQVEVVYRSFELDPAARVVMCSALGQESKVLESIKLGAKDFVVKPFQPERILDAAAKALA